MIIECPYCESKVDGKVLAEHDELPEEGDFPIKVSLLECPICKNAILAYQELYLTSTDRCEYTPAARLWPEPERHVDSSIPELVRSSLVEAQKCYKAKANNACAVMCGRVLESICSEHKTKNKFLAGGLRELLEKKVIDKKIYLWGEALRKHRNIGAHIIKGKKISKEDAKDLLDFANAICDYVFVLTIRFENFMKRKEKSKKK